MQEDNLCWFWTLLAVSYIGLWLVVLWGLYGGNPQGCFVRIEKLQAQIEAKPISIDLTPLIDIINEQDKQIEILRTQVNQIMP